MVRALDERPRIGDHRERPAAEHHRRGHPFVQLGDQLAGPVPLAAQLPAFHRDAGLGRQRGLELVDGARRPQLVVAPEVGERRAWSRGPRDRVGPGRAAEPRAGRRRSRRAAGPPTGSRPAARADVGLETVGPGPDGAPRPLVRGGIAPGRTPARRSVAATMRIERPSIPAAGRRACRHRRRSAPRATRTPPSVGSASPSRSRRDRMAGDGPRQLSVPPARQPGRRAVAMGERARRIVGRQGLVGIVQQGGGLDEAPVHGHAASLDPGGQPGGHLGHGPSVPNEPGRRIQGEQEGGGLHPPRHRHRLDGTRRRRRDPGVRRSVARRARAGDRRRLPLGDEGGDRDGATERGGSGGRAR